MPTPIWPPNCDEPAADLDQKRAAEIFRDRGQVLVEAPPGTGKTFLGVYLALCAYRLNWTTPHRKTLFLTFSRNARVQIENEINRYREKQWLSREEESSIKASNYHAFYLEMLRKKAGLWGCPTELKPASILERDQRLRQLLADLPGTTEANLREAGIVFALRRFVASDLMKPDSVTQLDNASLQVVFEDAANALKDGRPHYDDFAPLFLNLLEHCPALVEWLRASYPVVVLDEFQDTDIVQWQILQRINPKHLVVLYDRYQMIYEWRGSRVERLDQIGAVFGFTDTNMTSLSQNHRVGNAGNPVEFIQQLRADDLKGNLVVEDANRPWVTLVAIPPPNQPMANHVRSLNSLRWLGLLKDVETTAILTTNNAFAHFLFSHLRRKPMGKGPFFQCRWIGSHNNPDEKTRDWIWELREVTDDISLRAWIGNLLDSLLPKGSTDLTFAQQFACEGNELLHRKRQPEYVSVRNRLTPWWSEVKRDNLPRFSQSLRGLPELGKILLGSDGYLDPDLIYYIQALAKAVDDYSQGTGFPDWQDLCEYLEGRITSATYLKLRHKPRGLYVLTVHQSKGREFDHVIIPWLSASGEPVGDGIHWKPTGRYDFDKDEDRRLLYVALTRARKRVTIVYPEDDPSPFLTNWKLC